MTVRTQDSKLREQTLTLELIMNTVRYVVGEIATAPDLLPGQIWRRKIAPESDAWDSFHAQSNSPSYEDEYRSYRPEWSDARFETKVRLDIGDQFVAGRTDGGSIKLTVGASIPPGGNP